MRSYNNKIDYHHCASDIFNQNSHAVLPPDCSLMKMKIIFWLRISFGRRKPPDMETTSCNHEEYQLGCNMLLCRGLQIIKIIFDKNAKALLRSISDMTRDMFLIYIQLAI